MAGGSELGGGPKSLGPHSETRDEEEASGTVCSFVLNTVKSAGLLQDQKA